MPFVIIWFGADWLSHRMVSGAPVEQGATAWIKEQLLSLIVTAVGLFALVEAKSGFGSATSWILLDQGTPAVNFARFIKPSILLGLGHLCMIGAQPISSLLVVNKA